jgi:purine nucleosidase
VGADDKECIRALGTSVALAVAGLLDFFGHFHEERYGWAGAPLHDPCCVAELIRPGLITMKPMHVEVETSSPLTLGRTVCDIWGVTGRPSNARVGVDIDRKAFVEILMDCLGRY